MRTNPDARTIKVDKQKLIDKIKENKANHIKEYDEAVKAFKEEAQKRIAELSENLAAGKFDKMKLSMTVPENRSEEYDKLVTQFEWELDKEVELSQGEFNEYIHDETPFAKQAKFSNMAYSNIR
jgi:histidyl-tRNA synthetase